MVHSAPSIIKVFETDTASIRLRSDAIIHVHYKKNTTLDTALQVEMRNQYNQITGGVPHMFIFSAEDGFVITKEARDNSKNLQKNSPIKAYALLANNLAYRIVANFFMKVHKPPVPFKCFANENEAVRWLHSLKFE